MPREAQVEDTSVEDLDGVATGDVASAAASAISGRDLEGTSPGSGKAGAPAAGKDDAGKGKDESSSQQPPPEGQAEAEVPADDLQEALLEELGGSVPGGDEEQVRRDLAASSKEARRLKGVVDSLNSLLKEQGAEPVYDRGGNLVGLRALVKDASGEPKKIPPAPEFSKLDMPKQDLFVQDAQKAIDMVWADAWKQAERHFASPNATVARVTEPPSAEALDGVVKSLSAVKDRTGALRYPGLKALRPDMERLLESLPPEVQEAYYLQPGTMLGLIYDKVVAAKARLVAWLKQEEAQKASKAEEAKRKAGLSPSGAGTVVVGADSDASKQAASSIARSIKTY